ncbi:MAG TPA: MerR family transcriptional regulator [Candidatus Dormibacteraeota bacterium]
MSEGYPLRMRDLVRLTGVSAPTIHFYAQQGLLPAARKTAGNQARYAESTAPRIAWIRRIQQELRLSLRAIGGVLERWGELPLEEMRTLQLAGRLIEEPDPAVSAEELRSHIDCLTDEDVDTLRRLRLISAEGPLTASDLRFLDLVVAGRRAGFTPEGGFSLENLALYRDAVERIVQEEIARAIGPVLGRYDPQTLRDLVTRGLPIVDQMLSVLHRRAVQDEMQRILDHPGMDQATA